MERVLNFIEDVSGDFTFNKWYETGADILKNAKNISEKILCCFYGEKKIVFPVDIRTIIRQCEIDIYETNLNVDTGFQIERVNGYLKRKKDGGVIYVDQSDGEPTKRYIMAHELSHYIIDLVKEKYDGNEKINFQKCVDPLFPKSWDELMSDVVTSFLLFPPKLVLEYLDKYTQLLKARNTYPIDGFEWLRMLGQKAQVSTYFTIICYQYLKFYFCQLYNEDDDLIKQYEKFFK